MKVIFEFDSAMHRAAFLCEQDICCFMLKFIAAGAAFGYPACHACSYSRCSYRCTCVSYKPGVLICGRIGRSRWVLSISILKNLGIPVVLEGFVGWELNCIVCWCIGQVKSRHTLRRRKESQWKFVPNRLLYCPRRG